MTAGHAMATADGPDHWAVTDVAQNDVLNIRAAPNSKGTLLGTVPPDGDGLINIDCVGGLSINEWMEASEAERDAARKTRWCLIGYGDVVGWVAGWYLQEGGEDTAFKGGDWYIDLDGSEWRLRDVPGQVVPDHINASLQYLGDGEVRGFDACDRFGGKALTAPGRVVFDAVERSTRNKCLPEKREVSKLFNHALKSAKRHFTSHLIMVLFDEDYRVLATFQRRDFD